MAILQTTTIVTSGAGPVKVPGSSPLGAETVTDSILECVRSDSGSKLIEIASS